MTHGSVRRAIFVEAAREVVGTDPERALQIAVAAAVMRTYGADSGTGLAPDDVLVATLDDTPRVRSLRHLLVAMTQAYDHDWTAGVASLDRALAAGEEVEDREVLWNLANGALQLGDDAAQQHFYGRALVLAREAGAVTAVIYCLQRLCFGSYAAGDLVAVRGSAEEAVALGESIGQPALTALPLAWLAVLDALQDRDEYDARVKQLETLETTYPLGILADPVHDVGRWAKAVRCAGAGDHRGALHHFSQVRLPVLARMAATERIEAAVRAGDTDTARAWTEELAGFSEATGRPWAQAAVAYGRALTASQDEAEQFFVSSLREHAEAGHQLEAARTHLAYGEWLRRSQRRVDARQHLRDAVETFADLKARALESRANQELRASGETARKRDPSTLVQLTPTELQIARLVTSGLSNKEVAAQCWISPRTVAFHLRNIFAKAGVTSRGELAQLDLG